MQSCKVALAAQGIECVIMHVKSFTYTRGRRVANFESCRALHISVAFATDYQVRDDSPDGQPQMQTQHM